MQALHLFPVKRSIALKAVVLFCFPLFFIFLADSIMSYVFPILVEKGVGSNTVMGVIMALSSVLGIFCDFTFPQLLQRRSWGFQLVAGIIVALLFPIFSNLGTAFSLVYLFVIATLVWGVYFEFLQFSQQSFIVREEDPKEYARDWGTLFIIYQATIIIGPVIGSLLLKQLLLTSTLAINAMQIISLLLAFTIIFLLPKHPEIKKESQIKKTLNLLKELSMWEKLGERVWPAVIAGILVSFVNAAFWTIGGLLGLELFTGGGSDWLVMVVFGIPMVIGAFLLTKFSIQDHKKKYSQMSLFVGGVFLSFIFLVKGVPQLTLAIILLSSFALSFAEPLNEAVYSDLLERSGKSKMHLLGIAKSNTSFAYIVGPLFTGLLADKVGYSTTLSIVGGIAVITAIVLLLFTPRKIKLPQTALEAMEKAKV